MTFLIGTWWIFAILSTICSLVLVANFVAIAKGNQEFSTGAGLHLAFAGLGSILGLPAIIGFIGWLIKN